MTRIAIAQMAMTEAMEPNYRKSIDFIQKAAAGGAALICFPEGQLGYYIPQYEGLKVEDFALPLDHGYIQGLQQACRDNHIIGVFGLNLMIDGAVYPSMVTVSETGDLLDVTTKKHIVHAYHFYEQDYFTPGKDGFHVVDTSIGKIGTIVCFDRHFPESFRTLALKGADLVLTGVANEKIEPCEVFQWELRIPAFQNSMYTVMANRVGREGIMDFCGESVVAGPAGNVLVVGDDQEGLLYADVDFAYAHKVREEKQYLKLRRSDVFEL